MAYGLLLLRAFVGLAFIGHGTQKLFGWFGGYGPQGTGGFFGQLGYRSPVLMAIAAGLCETVGGTLLALGLLTPVAAFLIATIMLNAMITVTWGKKEGLWKGSELELVFLVAAIALAATGPGRFSLDRAIGWDDNISGLAWAAAAFAGAVAVSFVTTTIGRGRAAATEVPA
jgi:putative oxidoreductase